MSAHWHTGMKLVCVNADGTDNLHEKAVYTLKAIDGEGYSEALGFSDVCVLLVDADPNPGTIGFAARRFRPVQKRATNIEVFRALLNPTPEQREDIELADFILDHAPMEKSLW